MSALISSHKAPQSFETILEHPRTRGEYTQIVHSRFLRARLFAKPRDTKTTTKAFKNEHANKRSVSVRIKWALPRECSRLNCDCIISLFLTSSYYLRRFRDDYPFVCVYIITYDIQKKENDIKSYASTRKSKTSFGVLSSLFLFLSRVFCVRA